MIMTCAAVFGQGQYFPGPTKTIIPRSRHLGLKKLKDFKMTRKSIRMPRGSCSLFPKRVLGMLPPLEKALDKVYGFRTEISYIQFRYFFLDGPVYPNI